MSYSSIRKQTHAAANPPEFSNRCHASGCPCRGTISMEGGHFLCSAHAFIPADQWPRVTQKLREHEWLIAFIGDMQRMDRHCEDWRGFAVQFWHNQDDYCKPDSRENAIPYQNRMRAELLYRCGLVKRPAVRLPQPLIKRFGNAAQAAAGALA